MIAFKHLKQVKEKTEIFIKTSETVLMKIKKAAKKQPLKIYNTGFTVL